MMKHNTLRKVMAIVLVVCLSASVMLPASAASLTRWGTPKMESGSIWNSFWDKIFAPIFPDHGMELPDFPWTPSEPEKPVKPEIPETPAITKSEYPSDIIELIPMDGDTDAKYLRAGTYEVVMANDEVSLFKIGDATDPRVLKYFPVTLYDYNVVQDVQAGRDTVDFNDLTHQADLESFPDADTWQGIYFGGNSLGADVLAKNGSDGQDTYKPTETGAAAHENLKWSDVQNRTYYLDEACSNRVSIREVVETIEKMVNKGAMQAKNVAASNTGETYTRCGNYFYLDDAGSYLPIYATYGGDGFTGYYWRYKFYADRNGEKILIEKNQTKEYKADDTTQFPIYEKTTTETVTGYELVDQNGGVQTTLTGTNLNQRLGVTLYTQPVAGSPVTKGYANWNKWTGETNNGGNGNAVYSGLVENRLDSEKNIQFKYPEGGIFTDEEVGKKVYHNVEMPFVYEKEGAGKGYYTFDSSLYGVYFNGDKEQNQPQGASTEPADGARLYLNEKNTQKWTGMGFGDGSTNLWAPFNGSDNVEGPSNVNYFFGMNATIPFGMTADGMITGTNGSTPITFSFSGDDDVWIFIDGHLVIDLGGVHNRIDAKIDFSDGPNGSVTYAIATDNTQNSAVDDVAQQLFRGAGWDHVDPVAETHKGGYKTNLFGSLIPHSREQFASDTSHELTIFYLERGAGSSNARIKFNLPMFDTMTVTKKIDKAWQPTGAGLGSGEGETVALTPEQQEQVNRIDFGMTLWKKEAEGQFAPLKNTGYELINPNGQVVGTGSTDTNGHFYLKNGYSIRFTGDLSPDGVSYYVVEDKEIIYKGFIAPDFTYAGFATNGFDCLKSSGEILHGKDASKFGRDVLTQNAIVFKSSELTARGGGTEAEDTLSFICENYLEMLPDLALEPQDDRIVLDFGLGVDIDVLENDLVLGGTAEIVRVTGDGMSVDDQGNITDGGALTFGTAATDGKIISYQLNKDFHDVEILNYAVKLSASTGAGQTQTITKVAKVYVIPATIMYYEENFGDMVKTRGKWETLGTSDNEKQEPGVVGTRDDSAYGSDRAYLNDSLYSNGTILKADLTAAENRTNGAQFAYRFTGIGTAFYGHQNNNTGLMRVRVYAVDAQGRKGELLTEIFRDTILLPNQDSQSMTYDELNTVPIFDNLNEGLPYGTYEVQVHVYPKGTPTNVTGGSGGEFYLDGIRVYGPTDLSSENYKNIDNPAYSQDGEAYRTMTTIMDHLLSTTVDTETGMEWPEGEGFISFTDTNGSLISAQDYKTIGPKDEVYLTNGQSVSFTLKNWQPGNGRVYLGVKAPAGPAAANIGHGTLPINNALDCYYDITPAAVLTEQMENGVKVTYATFTITASGQNIVGLTNIKVTGMEGFQFVPGIDENV